MKSGRRIGLYIFWRILKESLGIVARLRGFLVFWRWDIRIESGVSIDNPGDIVVKGPLVLCRGVKIRTSGPGSVSFGHNVIICSYTTIESAGGRVEIGDSIVVGEYSTFQGQGGICLGNDVLLASHIHFISNHHEFTDPVVPISQQPDQPKEIQISSGSWIGINVTILSGTTLGENSVVATGSVVKGAVVARTVVGGIPAKLLKKYDSELKSWTAK